MKIWVLENNLWHFKYADASNTPDGSGYVREVIPTRSTVRHEGIQSFLSYLEVNQNNNL